MIAAQFSACALAWWRSRTEREHVTIAALLTWFLVTDGGRYFTAAFLSGVPRPFTGIHRVVFHADQGLFLSWTAATVATAVVVFLGMRPWIPLVAVLLAWVGFAVAYPGLHGTAMLSAYRTVYLIGTMATISAIIVGLGSGRVERPARRHLVLMILSGGDLLFWATSWISASHPNWQFSIPANTFTFALIAAVHLPARWAELPTRS